MDRSSLLTLLSQLNAGTLSHEEAVRRVERDSFEDLGFAKLDHQRDRRTGFPEVVFAAAKTDEQLAEICRRLWQAQRNEPRPRLLVTRLEPARQAALAELLQAGLSPGEAPEDALPAGRYDALARTWSFGLEQARSLGLVLVLCAGTSDLPVAQEALETARLMDCRTELIADVGVAGLHRLTAHLERIRQARVVIVVAGMDGALPSVVGGLVRNPVIAVPTSVGYGAGFQGLAPLLTMLNSCAPGVTVVNIDNGFGAGFAAALINTLPASE